MDPLGYRGWHRRRLPHWQPVGAVLSVTFRLVDSLPADVAARLRLEAAWGRDCEAWLDRMGCGPRWLAAPDVAQVVADALRWRDGRVYRLIAYCIMPNHVHVLFQPLEVLSAQVAPVVNRRSHDEQTPVGHRRHAAGDTDLQQVGIAAIMHSLKRRTALDANRLLGRSGAFWAREYFDHWLRTPSEVARAVDYVVANPVTAGLAMDAADWPWTYQATSAT